MPARINDSGIGQRQLNESDVRKVVRHLVDEKRRCAFPVNARALEVPLTQFTAFRGAQIHQRLRIRDLRIAAHPAAEVAGNRHHVGQFHCPFDRRMAGQNLLEQRRSGARQADDEDRIARLRSEARALREESSIEQRLGAAHEIGQLVGIIGNLGAALPIAITAAAGIIGAKHKVAASLLVTTGMSVGAVTGGVAGGPLMGHFGWQSIFVTGGVLPFLLVPAFFRILAARSPVIADAAAVRVSTPLKALFENGLGAYTCLLWLFSFLIFMDVYALLFWVPTLLVDFGFTLDHASVGMAAFSGFSRSG